MSRNTFWAGQSLRLHAKEGLQGRPWSGFRLSGDGKEGSRTVATKICGRVLCLMFLVFLRSRSGSFKAFQRSIRALPPLKARGLTALITRLVAFGSTSTLAARFWIVSFTVTRMP